MTQYIIIPTCPICDSKMVPCWWETQDENPAFVAGWLCECTKELRRAAGYDMDWMEEENDTSLDAPNGSN